MRFLACIWRSNPIVIYNHCSAIGMHEFNFYAVTHPKTKKAKTAPVTTTHAHHVDAKTYFLRKTSSFVQFLTFKCRLDEFHRDLESLSCKFDSPTVFPSLPSSIPYSSLHFPALFPSLLSYYYYSLPCHIDVNAVGIPLIKFHGDATLKLKVEEE